MPRNSFVFIKYSPRVLRLRKNENDSLLSHGEYNILHYVTQFLKLLNLPSWQYMHIWLIFLCIIVTLHAYMVDFFCTIVT
jgi:hypothetical protein